MSGSGPVEVEVVQALQGRASVKRVRLVAGATVADAIAAAGLADALTEAGAGIWGRRVPPDTPVRHGDRVELYRSLQADPKQARRRRLASRGRVG